MQRLPLILGAAAFGALALAAPAQAACNPAAEKITGGPAVIYDGAIGDEPARIAITFGKDGNVEARYALATSPADIVIRGKLEPDGKSMTLTQLDERGQPKAVFAVLFPDEKQIPVTRVQPKAFGGAYFRPVIPSEGPMPPDTVFLKSGAGCGTFGGSWQEAGGVSQPLNFNRTRTIDHPQFGHLYAIAGVNDDEIVNRKAQAFRQAVVDGRPEEIAKHIRLPMTFTIRGKLVVIANTQDLKARFDDIFPQSIRDGLAELVPRMMEANESGITLRNMWFDSEGYLIAF